MRVALWLRACASWVVSRQPGQTFALVAAALLVPAEPYHPPNRTDFAQLRPLEQAPRELAGGGESSAPGAAQSCARRIEAELALPGLPGTPELDAARAHILLYAKAEPVAFVRRPRVDPHSTKSAITYRARLERSISPASVLRQLWGALSAKPEVARQVLLREGYLYAEEPALAFALVEQVSPQLLFNDEHIWVHRGERVLRAERTRKGNYVYLDGPEKGERVKLGLFDRIGNGEPPPALHRDFRELRSELGFDRVKFVRLDAKSIVADLRYGNVWVRTLLRSEGAHLALDCEADLDTRSAITVAMAREQQRRKDRVLGALRRSILAQMEEKLPFDEPRTEVGQQDGQLRRRWLKAYQAGKTTFKFNGDKYYVYDIHGRPLVPQVCVDFIFDSFERASGTWWRERGEMPQRVKGKLDFGTNENPALRRGTSIVEFAARHPAEFEVELLREEERIPFKFGRDLARYLEQEADRYAPGDIVLIRGFTPWDDNPKDRQAHVHSFFIYESDPITGFPLTLAGNPGRPLLQTWQFEAYRTPERSIWYRIRPKLSWLERVVVLDPAARTAG